MAVASVKLVKNFPDSGLQTGRQELDIPLDAEVHDLINPLCDTQLDVRAQSDLESRDVLMFREGSTYQNTYKCPLEFIIIRLNG